MNNEIRLLFIYLLPYSLVCQLQFGPRTIRTHHTSRLLDILSVRLCFLCQTISGFFLAMCSACALHLSICSPHRMFTVVHTTSVAFVTTGVSYYWCIIPSNLFWMSRFDVTKLLGFVLHQKQFVSYSACFLANPVAIRSVYKRRFVTPYRPLRLVTLLSTGCCSCADLSLFWRLNAY